MSQRVPAYDPVLHDVARKVHTFDDGRWALRAKRLMPMTDDVTVHADQVVTVDGGRVTSIEPAATPIDLPADRVLDIPSGTLLPGMIETHCHVTGEWVSDPHATHLEPFPEARVLRGMVDAWAVLLGGFSTLFSMGHGHPNYVSALKTLIDDEHFPGPRVYHCGWALSQTAGHGHVREWNYDLVASLRVRSAFADGPTALRALVRENVGTGAEFIKLFAGEGGYTAPPHIARRLNFTPEELQAVTNEAHRMGVRVAAHCMSLDHARHAVENGVDRVEHGPIVYEPEFVPMLAEHGASWCPTLSQLHWGIEERAKRGLSAEAVARIERALDARCRMISEALDAGVTVGFGTDNRMRPKAGQNGIEFRLMTDRGISPAAALSIATRRAARLVGVDGDLGTLEVGKVADMIVVDGDPLTDVACIATPDHIQRVFRSPVRVRPAAPRVRRDG